MEIVALSVKFPLAKRCDPVPVLCRSCPWAGTELPPHAVAAALECTCRDKDPTSASALEVRDLVAAASERDAFK